MREHCPVLDRFNAPAGDCVTLSSYRAYVERLCRDELTMEELRDLLIWFHCGVEELVDKVCEVKLVGQGSGKGRDAKCTR